MRGEFQVHRLNERGMKIATSIAEAFSQLLDAVDAQVPSGRDRSLVVTKLQEACFFAKRAIAVAPENQLDYVEPQCDGHYADEQGAIRPCTSVEGCGVAGCPYPK